MTATLRELLARPDIVVAPGIYDGLTALLVELADLVGEAAVDDGGHGGHGRSGGVGGEDPGHGRPFRR